MDSHQDDNWQRYGACFSPGSRWIGVVKRLTNFGAFVDLPGHLDGLLHISEMAEEEIESVEDAVKVGQLVTVTILRADLEERRIGVSLKPSVGGGATVSSSPIEIQAEWLTESVLGLARAIRSDGYCDRGLLAILADALEEAGCEAEELLDYCRNTELSVERQGWWVTEAILRASQKPAARHRCPNDAMAIPLTAEVVEGSEIVRFYWCWSCIELFAFVGEPGRLAAGFARDTQRGGWRMFRVYGADTDVQAAVSAVSQVAPLT